MLAHIPVSLMGIRLLDEQRGNTEVSSDWHTFLVPRKFIPATRPGGFAGLEFRAEHIGVLPRLAIHYSRLT